MRKNMLAVIATGFVITILTITSCNREYNAVASYDTSGSGNAYLRVVHAAPYFRKIFNVPDTFNVLVGGTKITGYLPGGNVVMTYGTIFPNAGTGYGYVAVPVGEQEIKLTLGSLNVDSVTIKRFTKTLAAGNYYTFMVTDSINSNRDIAQIFVRDSLTTPTTGYFNLRFIHAVLEDTASGQQKTVDTIDVFSTRNNRNIYTKITPGTITTFSQFAYNPQLNDTFFVRRTRNTSNLDTLAGVSLSNQRTYTLYYRGDGNIGPGAATGTNPRRRTLGVYVHK